MAYDANVLRVPEIRWLGVFTSDFEEYCLPDCCQLPLSSEDTRKLEGILTRCYLHREAPEWRLKLEEMLEKGVKFEIEALSSSSISFLSQEYIPQKIKLGTQAYQSITKYLFLTHVRVHMSRSIVLNTCRSSTRSYLLTLYKITELINSINRPFNYSI